MFNNLFNINIYITKSELFFVCRICVVSKVVEIIHLSQGSKYNKINTISTTKKCQIRFPQLCPFFSRYVLFYFLTYKSDNGYK